MLAYAEEIWNTRQRWGTAALVGVAILAAIVISVPNLLRTHLPARQMTGEQTLAYGSGAGGGSRDRLVTRNGAATIAALPTSDGVVGGVPGGGMGAGVGGARPNAADGRKIVRTGYLDLVVSSPVDALSSAQAIAQKLDGYVATSEVSGSAGRQQSASAVIWVPATQFDAARNELRGLARHVDSERTNASDVTMQYVDTESALRNYRAEEARYLEIMKRAVTVKDTLAVSEKLADVRGRIDATESEFRALTHQVEMTSIAVNLLSEPVASSGLNWRPAYRVKEAARMGLEALADFVSSATEFVFQIPAILLWAASIFFAIKIGWLVLKRAVKSFGWAKRSAS